MPFADCFFVYQQIKCKYHRKEDIKTKKTVPKNQCPFYRTPFHIYFVYKEGRYMIEQIYPNAKTTSFHKAKSPKYDTLTVMV